MGEKKLDENEQEGEMETDETTVEPVKDLQMVRWEAEIWGHLEPTFLSS